MKIVMLGWELPPHNSGGLGVACYHLAKALSAHASGIDFVVPYTAQHDEVDFMRVHAATELDPLHRLGFGAYDHWDLGAEDAPITAGGASFAAIRKKYNAFVRGNIDAWAPDIIHVHDWMTFEAGVLAKLKTGAPLIAHVHATEFDRAGGNSGHPLIHEIEYEGLVAADLIIAVSDITKKMIVSRYKIPADKIKVVHNSLDPKLLEDLTREAQLYRYVRDMQEEGYIVISTVGRLTLQKGLVYFLHAAAKASHLLDRMIFIIAGDGEQRHELIQLAADLGISDRVLFTGFVRGQALKQTYAASDVFVMSSISEPFGLTALEAAAYDKAIVLSKQSGVGEVMKAVLRYDYWDVNKLADQIINLATSQSLREELGRNVGQEVRRSNWQHVGESLYGHMLRARAEVAG